MRKSICFALLICMGNLAFSQQIIISGINKNRLLSWDDFKGEPDKNSPHAANTFWNITYNINGISFKEDTAKIDKFSVTLKLDETFSWTKPEKQTNLLLKHEQGHFDIGLICQREIITQLNSTIFLKSDFQNKIQTIFSSTLEKYHLLGQKYDEETNHSRNQDAQDNWNNFLANELK